MHWPGCTLILHLGNGELKKDPFWLSFCKQKILFPNVYACF